MRLREVRRRRNLGRLLEENKTILIAVSGDSTEQNQGFCES